MDYFWTDHFPIHTVLNPHFCGGKLHGQLRANCVIEKQGGILKTENKVSLVYSLVEYQLQTVGERTRKSMQAESQ